MKTYLPAVALSVGAFLSACGGSSDPAAGPCSDLAKAECAKLMTCTNGSGITRDYGDLHTCQTRLQLQCTLGAAAPSTGNTPAHITACVAAFPNYSCEDFLTNNPPAACIQIGTIATGSACEFNGQCTTGFCNNVKTALCGTCAAPPAAGTSCQDANCARQQECVARTLTCQGYGAAQASCDNNAMPCGPHLSCDGNTGGNPGTCMTAVGTVSMACGGSLAGCDGTIGLTCGGTVGSKSCVAFPFAANGQPCGTLIDGSFGSCQTGECYTASGVAQSGETGTCGASAKEGQPCDSVIGPPCLTPARCVVDTSSGGTSGTCTLPTSSAKCT